MKKNNRKGFTIVELVIVIAVIAILAGVLIPTFSGIVEKANKSAAVQEAQNVYKEVYAIDLSDGNVDNNIGGTEYTAAGGKLSGTIDITDTTKFKYTTTKGYTATYTYNTKTWDVAKS
jgi:type IV pilus assembly protein PilA